MAYVVAYAVVVLVKLPAYSVWISKSSRSLAGRQLSPRAAVGLGALRILLGLGVGTILNHLGYEVQKSGGPTQGYFTAFTIARFVEWSVIAAIIQDRDPVKFFRPAGTRDLAWRIGGVGVSWATDVPVALMAFAVAFAIVPC